VMIGEKNSSRYNKWKFLKSHGIIRHTVCWEGISLTNILCVLEPDISSPRVTDDLPCTTSARIFMDFFIYSQKLLRLYVKKVTVMVYSLSC
jgi:hypothetical protein